MSPLLDTMVILIFLKKVGQWRLLYEYLPMS
jgi:hypothetical protein